jgi:fructuronate reductase
MTRARLTEATLAGLPAEVARPGYDRRRVRTGVVHLGLGAFHRAHQAPVFDRLLSAGHLEWGVTAVGVRSAAVRDRLAAQDGLYAVLEREGDARRLSVRGAIREVMVAAEATDRLAAAIADAGVRLVTLTLTETGYERGGPIWPLLARALEARRAARAPLTIASCDNLGGNGARAKSALLAVSAPRLADWIEAACAFPDSMVDRITPATTDADLDEIEAMLGVRDAAAVVTEPFWQWVIQDRFADARPPLEVAGVQVVDDVAPFERAKLRLLNAAHSTLAYVGLLCGFSFVHEAVRWPPLRRLVQRLWDEAELTLAATPGLGLAAYRAQLLRRFDNPSLAHRLDQIARDGSRKLPQRLLAPLAERSGQGRASPAMVFALAAWLACIESRADIVDPSLGVLQVALLRSGDGFAAMAAAGMTPDDQWISPALRAALARSRARLTLLGPRAATAEAAA